MQPVTEQANDYTTHLDSGSAIDMVRMLRQVDGQLFSGWNGHEALFDRSILDKLERLSRVSARLVDAHLHQAEQHPRVVFSGCGTSGRVAWLCARVLNLLVARVPGPAVPRAQPLFAYLISGDDQSLVISNELPEDDPGQGAADLVRVTRGCTQVLFVGITCGLSAPYVAGQISHSMAQAGWGTVLMGFNPVHLARNVPIEKWDRTCRDVFLELHQQEQQQLKSGHEGIAGLCCALTPVVGPEALTASSRMKGGSMSKILLETVFLSVLLPRLGAAHDTSSQKRSCQNTFPVAEVAALYQHIYREAYEAAPEVAVLLEGAGTCLQQEDAHLYYVGVGSAALVGLMDQSEMVDTYGCRLDEVQAFVVGGWDVFHNSEGDLSSRGGSFALDATTFESKYLANLTAKDLVIFLRNDSDRQDAEAWATLQRIEDKVAGSAARYGKVTVCQRERASSVRACVASRCISHAVVALTHYDVDTIPVYAEFALKLVLNVITTGANVMKGAVYGNRMINLTVSNNKLYHRSAEIVSLLTGVSGAVAEGEEFCAGKFVFFSIIFRNSCASFSECLLRAIYRCDKIDEAVRQLPLSTVIEKATPMTFIVPRAALLATGHHTLQSAHAALHSGQRLRDLLRAALNAGTGTQ
eukprot:m.173075 g.173075  ORF g.173075 m.173075 type:complete len:639 (+) comp21291_c0_seq7:49-1965(+)